MSPSIFPAYRRFPHLRPTNHAPQRRQPTHSSASVALTQLRRAQTSIALGARRTTACRFPRVPSLKAFGRRPRCKLHRCDRPASETLNMSGSQASTGYKNKSRPKAALQFKFMIDQAAINADFGFRRYAMKPTPAKPRIIIAHVEGSGTADARVIETLVSPITG
jgi:hypothetical protein